MRSQNQRPDQKLARFATRYRIAGQLESVSFLGLGAQTKEIYTIILRISLAYSSLESLESHIGKRKIALVSQVLASRYKSPKCKEFQDFCIAESDLKLRRRLEILHSNQGNNDLRPVIEAIRNTMFHGQFSPSAAGVKTKWHGEFLQSVELLLFRRLDEVSKATFEALLAKDHEFTS